MIVGDSVLFRGRHTWQRKQLRIVLVDDDEDEYGRKPKIQDWSEDLI